MKNIAVNIPEWLGKNAVYQINPRNFSKEGTINAVTKELSFIKECGFNIVYLCPIFEEDASEDRSNWSRRQLASKTENPKNMYRMSDYFGIDEEYGTMNDLKNMIKKAHELDMKVLLDVVYAHIGPGADIIKRHPEFVKQKSDGSFICTEWNFPMLDFNCEGLREYLYCNMLYYIAVIDADGFRCDVGDAVPYDFWKEARRRMHCVKEDSVLINEGRNYEWMCGAFDSTYCFIWHEYLRSIFCDDTPASELRKLSEELAEQIPINSMLLRDMDNHDTVSDWDGRTETKAGNMGMEQIEVINYMVDGIPMVFAGNELACEAELNLFANRFYQGEYEVTDRDDKNSEKSIRRQKVMKKLNKMKTESDLLRYGKTIWIDNSDNDNIISFKREWEGKEIIFIGNAKNVNTNTEINKILEGKNCILSNGECRIKDNKLYLEPFEYVVFE